MLVDASTAHKKVDRIFQTMNRQLSKLKFGTVKKAETRGISQLKAELSQMENEMEVKQERINYLWSVAKRHGRQIRWISILRNF
mmetsp:Transcript_40759/g.62210  ORF Transcript_40759/g.62210 Transcript_40759/m.62210 type:complete len:84 (-) Transcript_40759:1043-1294(-)